MRLPRELHLQVATQRLRFPLKNRTYRICHLAKYYPPTPGGIETHVQTLARAQSALGSTVQVICVNGHSETRKSSRHSQTSYAKGVLGQPDQITRTQYDRDQAVKVIRAGRWFSIARFDLLRLSGYKPLWAIFQQSWDVVHLHTPNPTMLVAWLVVSTLSWLLRKPTRTLVITHHSDIIRQRLLKYALRPLEYLVYRQASCILTTSAAYIEGSRFLRAFRDRVSPLPLGVDCAPYWNPTAIAQRHVLQLRQQWGSPLWLCVGRLVYYKALHVAIEALTQVPGRLLIIGVGALESELRELVHRHGLEDRVIWYGQASAEELIAAYHAATALWLPSNVRSEGFGIVQLEAMASGCPVINTAIPCSGVPWVSRHEQEGLTIPISHPTALAQAAQRLLDEPNLRAQLAIASRQRVHQEFDHILMAKRSLDLYQQALAKTHLDIPLFVKPLSSK